MLCETLQKKLACLWQYSLIYRAQKLDWLDLLMDRMIYPEVMFLQLLPMILKEQKIA